MATLWLLSHAGIACVLDPTATGSGHAHDGHVIPAIEMAAADAATDMPHHGMGDQTDRGSHHDPADMSADDLCATACVTTITSSFDATYAATAHDAVPFAIIDRLAGLYASPAGQPPKTVL